MDNHATDEGAEPRNVTDADRLCAEFDRLQAERRKLTLEADQIERELALPFFRRSGFVKAAAAGILALPLIWFYLDKIVIPYQNAKSELLSLENTMDKDKMDQLKDKLDDLQEDLAKRRQELEASRQQLTETEARFNDSVQALKTAQAQEQSRLELLKREDKEARTTAKIAQMQADLTRRNGELTAAFSSLSRISEELARPVPAPPAAAPAPETAAPLPTISGATVILHTTGDDKDEEGNVSIAINASSGAVFTWKEDDTEEWNRGSDKRIDLNLVTALPLSLLENATIEICMSRKTAHGWKFDYTGNLLIGTEAALSFGRKGNVIPHSAGVSCVGARLRIR
jgi:hypothetical protein